MEGRNDTQKCGAMERFEAHFCSSSCLVADKKSPKTYSFFLANIISYHKFSQKGLIFIGFRCYGGFVQLRFQQIKMWKRYDEQLTVEVTLLAVPESLNSRLKSCCPA